MPSERPWQGYGLGHTPAPLHRLPAQLTPRAADSRRSAPLAADATVSCATVETPVSHHTPSPSGSVPRASAPVTAPRCIRRALAFRPRSSARQRPHPNPRRIQRRRRVPSDVSYRAERRSNCPRSLRPGPSRPRPHGSDSITRPRSSLPFPGASYCPSRRRTVISRAQSPGFSQCPASQLIAFAAPLRRQRLLRMPPERPWQGYGLGHTLAPLHRPPAQLTPRAADSRRSAPLAADATVRWRTGEPNALSPLSHRIPVRFQRLHGLWSRTGSGSCPAEPGRRASDIAWRLGRHGLRSCSLYPSALRSRYGCCSLAC